MAVTKLKPKRWMRAIFWLSKRVGYDCQILKGTPDIALGIMWRKSNLTNKEN